MRASTSIVLVFVCSWTFTASLAYDYSQTYQPNTQQNPADRRSDGLVFINRENQPGDMSEQPGPYEAPAYHEDRIQYDESELDPFSARNAGPSQYAAVRGAYANPAPAPAPLQDEQPSPYQTPEDRAAMEREKSEAAAPSAQEAQTTQTQADQSSQDQQSQSSPYQTPTDIAASQASPYQSPADEAQATLQAQVQSQREQNTPSTQQQDMAPTQEAAAAPATTEAASLPQQYQTTQADQSSSQYQGQSYAQPASEQAVSQSSPPPAQAATEAPAAPAVAPVAGAADSAAYTQTPQLLNDEKTVSTLPSENKEAPAETETTTQPKQEETQKQEDVATNNPNIQFHLNRAGYSQMTMLDSNPGVRIMPPALQETVFKQLGVVPPPQSDQESSGNPQEPAQQEKPEQTESTSVQEVQSDVKEAEKGQSQDKSKGNIMNYTLRVKPEHKDQPEVQDIAFFPSDNAEGKPLLVLKQNVTRPIVENIEITLPKGHTGKPVIKVFRDGTPEAQALEHGKSLQHQDQQQQETLPTQHAQEDIPEQKQSQQEDQEKQDDKENDAKTEKDKPKKYYDTEGNEIPPPPYDEYPGSMEDLKQSFTEVPIPYHDNPACVSYTPQHCGNVWTQRNCPHLCKIKMFKESKKPVVLGQLPCFDYPECKRYPTTLCDPKFGHHWVRDHCRKMCGICKKSSLLCYDRAKCKVFQISDCAHKFVKYTCPKKCASCAAQLALWDVKEVHGFPYKRSSIAHKIHKHHKSNTHKRTHHKRSRRDVNNPLPDIEGPCTDKPECPTFSTNICHHQWMRRNCPDMCGICEQITKQRKKQADEKANFCSNNDHSDCARYSARRCQEAWLGENCKHMCGRCPQENSAQAALAAPPAPAIASYTNPSPLVYPSPQNASPAYAPYQPASYPGPGKRSVEDDENDI